MPPCKSCSPGIPSCVHSLFLERYTSPHLGVLRESVLTCVPLPYQGSATLSMAYAGALFADACLRGLNGEPNVVECSFVESNVTELPFFASKVKLGPKGAWLSGHAVQT